jgi:2-iminobutanoate/2-iminopropanoate deaminase
MKKKSGSLAWLVALLALSGCAPPLARREAISTPNAPAAIGPYSQAIRSGDAVYVAGQIGLDPATGKMAEGGIEAETRRALENVRAVLAAAGLGLEDVVQTQVFLQDLDDFQAMNAVYAGFFPRDPPARATVQVARLPRGARVEILAVALGKGRKH